MTTFIMFGKQFFSHKSLFSPVPSSARKINYKTFPRGFKLNLSGFFEIQNLPDLADLPNQL